MSGLAYALERLRNRLRRVTSSGDYIAQIDGLRFLAIVPVLMFHLGSRSARGFEKIAEPTATDAALASAAQVIWPAKSGVELFFVISGFIIAWPFVQAARGTGAVPSLRAFYTRRLTRLEPPYILALLGTFFFLTLSGRTVVDGVPLWQSLLASLVYVHGLVYQELPHVLPVAWSLEVEFAFYVLAPLLFALYFAIPSAHARIATGIATIVLLLVAINPLQAWVGDLVRFVLPRFLHLFVAGVVFCDLLALRPPRQASRRRSVGPDLLFLAGIALAVATEPLMQDYRRPTNVALELARVGGYASIFVGAFYGHHAVRFLRWGWVPTIGGMCYTLYLTHLPIQEVLVPLAIRTVQPGSFAAAYAVSALVAMPVVAAVGIGYFLLVERPCMARDWHVRLWASLRR